MTYADAEAFLLARPRFSQLGAAAYQPGLARMEALLDVLGRPHDAFASVHVAGTNGKGSTASMLAAIATASGRRVGLHTSPHLWHLNERFRIDGVPAPEAWTAAAVARYGDALAALRPSFFETTTALAFRYFADEAVDVAVVEVGLGGRLDATNVLRPRLAVITSIGLDHTDLLGETLGEIAREKAGIIKPGVPVLSGAVQPEAHAAIAEAAAAHAAPLHRLDDEATLGRIEARLDGLVLDLETPRRAYPALRLDLTGGHQARNAALAVRAAEILFEELPESVMRAGLGAVRQRAGLRGRLEVRQRAPLVVADVAHNADSLAAALAFIEARRDPAGRLCVVLGLMRDKEGGAVARLLAEAGAEVFTASVPGGRAWPAGELGALLQAHGVPVVGAGAVAEGVAAFRTRAAPADALLVTGSHYVVAALPEAEMSAPAQSGQ